MDETKLTYCEEMQSMMHEKIDGTLPADKELELDEHMRHCPDCRNEYFQLSALVDYLVTTPIDDVPEDFMDSVMAEVKIPLRYRLRDKLRKIKAFLDVRPTPQPQNIVTPDGLTYCELMQSRMHEKIEGSISIEDQWELDVHMAECPDCRREYYQLKALVEYLVNTPIDDVPEDFMDNVMSKVKIPLRYRVRDFFKRIVSIFLLQPLLIFGGLLVVVLSWISYLFLVEKIVGLMEPGSLKQSLVMFSDVQHIPYFINDIVTNFKNLFIPGDFVVEVTRIFLAILATISTTLSYLLLVAILILLTWTLMLYKISETRRLAYVKAQ